MRRHTAAPRWSREASDGLEPADLATLRAFEDRVGAAEKDIAAAAAILRDAVGSAIERGRSLASHYRRTLANVPRGHGPEGLASLPTTDRAALRAAPQGFVPQDADLGRMVVLRGPGEPPAQVPHHPAALACDAALLRAMLRRRGIRAEFATDLAGVFHVALGGGSYVCELGAFDGAGFARLDLAEPSRWRDAGDPVRFLAAFAPPIVLGTAPAIEDLARRAEDVHRRAPGATPPLRTRAVLVSGDLAPQVRERVERAFGAPAVEWYGATEAGPLAFGCKMHRGLHLLPPDIAIEVLPDTEEVALTGGRNPFLPLIRYRTGDLARLQPPPCPCGDPAPRLVGLRRGGAR